MTDALSLVTVDDPLSPISEAYRTLRMNLQFAALDRELRTLLVTSPGADEGKTTTLANLAVTMSQVEQRVTLIDCDLRRPSLHTLFHLPNDEGLTTMMVDDAALAEPPVTTTPLEGLFVLTSGPLPQRPPDLLGSKRMEKVLARLLDDADMLILDAPPIMAVADALVLAAKVDGVLLVVSAGETRREHAQRAVERLKRVNAPVIGAVLNNAPLDSALRGYYR